MYCAYCGSTLGDAAQFCSSCGRRQDVNQGRTPAVTGKLVSQDGVGNWAAHHPIWTIVILVFVVGMFSHALIGNVDSSRQPTKFTPDMLFGNPQAVSEAWTPGIGETAKVSSFGGGSDVLGFVSENALNEYKTASLSGQVSGEAAFRSLIAAGKVVATRRGTSVSVVYASGLYGWHKVRLVNGEHAGEAVYLLDQFTVYSK